MKQNILLFILILLISGCSQKEIEPSFSLQEETSSITLASAASSQTVISFTSTREWKASTSSEWLLISPTSGEAGTYQMALTASSKNNSKNSRTATVNLVSAGFTQSFTVTQSPAEYVELEQTTYYTEVQGGSLQIKFTTNLSTDELAIYGTASWLTQPANSRTDQAYVVNLTVLPNEDKKPIFIFVKQTAKKRKYLIVSLFYKKAPAQAHLLIILPTRLYVYFSVPHREADSLSY